MRHLDEGTIHAWLDGALSPDDAARAEAHVASCVSCADAVAEARGLIAASSRILTALDNVPYVKGARGAKGAEWGRRSLAVWLVRERIAAAVALIVAGGALTMMLSRDTPRTAPVQPVAMELTVADSPAPPTVAAADASNEGQATGAAASRAASPPRAQARDLAAARRPDSAPLARLDSAARVMPTEVANAAAPATDDTLRPVAVAEARREQAQLSESKVRLEERLRRVPGRGGIAEAPGRFAEPLAPQPGVSVRGGVGAAFGAGTPRIVQEERMTEGGREIRRRIYRIEDLLVTLDEHLPEDAHEERRAKVEAYAAAPPASAAAAVRDTTLSSMNTIRWTDARGAELTLTGSVPRERLEQIKKLLGY